MPLNAAMESSSDEASDNEQELVDQLEAVKRSSAGTPELVEFLATMAEGLNRRRVNLISTCYDLLPSPYDDVLTLLQRCPNYTTCMRRASGLYLLKSFQLWSRRSPTNWTIDDDLRRRAFRIATANHTQWFQSMCELYAFGNFLNVCEDGIVELINSNRLREAAVCIDVLKLHDRFTVEGMYLPLLLEHGVQVTLNCVRAVPAIVTELVRTLDANCFSGFRLNSLMAKYGVDRTKFNAATAEHFVRAACKMLNLSARDVAPNYCMTMVKRTVCYYVTLRYVRCTMPRACFVELIADAVLRYPYLRQVVFSKLRKHNDIFEVYTLRYALNLSNAELPSDVKLVGPLMLEQDHPMGDCLRLPATVKVIMVRGMNALKQAISAAVEFGVAAVDTEWTPQLCAERKAEASLMQIGVADKVYLIELDQLVKNCSAGDVEEQFRRFFCGARVLKLGFDFGNDVPPLLQTLPFCRAVLLNLRNVICIYKFAIDRVRALFGDDENIPDNYAQLLSNALRAGGLKKLCKLILGVDLDKRQQMSLWSRRPLRPEQIEYAALDVYSILAIYRKLNALSTDARRPP